MLVPWTIVLVYTFFSFFLGQNGLYARKHLETESIRLSENQRALEYTKREFIRTKENFISDRDSLSVYTRQLGYGTGDEKFIRIKGLSVAANPSMPVGQVVYAANSEFITDKVIKIISACFGLVVLAFFLIKDLFMASL
jgi:hypothetical protein